MVVCGFGIGSSMILKMKIESLLQEYNIAAEVFTADVTSVTNHQVDVILASKEIKMAIEDRVHAPILEIKNFLSTDELSKKLLTALKFEQL